MTRPIHLWAFLQGIGHYPSGWRHAGADPAGVFTMDYYRRIGELCERGRFDAIVYGDQLQSRGAGGRTPERLAMPTLDPVSLLAAIGSVTQHIGLVATVSTTYNAVAALAERFATLDRITGGRAGWNIVTTAHPASRSQFRRGQLSRKVGALCPRRRSSWLRPAQSGTRPKRRCRRAARCWSRPASRATGALSPRGRPRRSSARRRPSRPASPFAATCARRIAAEGRDPDGVRIMPGLSFILAASEAEADCQGRGPAGAGRRGAVHRISQRIDGLRSDPVRSRRADPGRSDPRRHAAARRKTSPGRSKSRPQEGLSLGAWASRYVRTPRGHNVFRGTPRQLADQMIEWIDAGACDGFTLAARLYARRAGTVRR